MHSDKLLRQNYWGKKSFQVDKFLIVYLNKPLKDKEKVEGIRDIGIT